MIIIESFCMYKLRLLFDYSSWKNVPQKSVRHRYIFVSESEASCRNASKIPWLAGLTISDNIRRSKSIHEWLIENTAVPATLRLSEDRL
jgi:hypothetical protein